MYWESFQAEPTQTSKPCIGNLSKHSQPRLTSHVLGTVPSRANPTFWDMYCKPFQAVPAQPNEACTGNLSKHGQPSLASMHTLPSLISPLGKPWKYEASQQSLAIQYIHLFQPSWSLSDVIVFFNHFCHDNACATFFSWHNQQSFLAWLYTESPVKDTLVTNDRYSKFFIHCYVMALNSPLLTSSASKRI